MCRDALPAEQQPRGRHVRDVPDDGVHREPGGEQERAERSYRGRPTVADLPVATGRSRGYRDQGERDDSEDRGRPPGAEPVRPGGQLREDPARQRVLCAASHEESVRLHEEINRNTEEFIESLGIPYHTVLNCGGDLGQGQVKKYDIELWVPGEKTYREISSASYFHDFQTRRFNIRYKDEGGVMRYAHSLNCTAIPTPRILVSLVENFQQEDGSVVIPQVLQKYFGKAIISK